MKITLLNLTVFDRDLKPQRSANAVNRSALQLGFDGVGMHGVATVDCSDDAFDIQITVAAYAYLNRMRGIAAEREMGCETNTATGGQRFAITDALGDEADQPGKPSRVECGSAMITVVEFALGTIKIDTQLQLVLTGLMSDFID